MSRPKLYIFANPIAGRGKGRLSAETLARSAADRGIEPVLWLEHSRLAPLPAADEQVLAAVAIGGDGTIRDVVRWTARSAAPIPIAVVPMGTANLLSQHLGLQWNAQDHSAEIIGAIRHGKQVHLDAASVNGGGLMLLVAGIGIDGHIVHELDRHRRGPISKLHYLLPSFKALANWTFPPMRVLVDDREIFASQSGLAMVGNIREYGAGFPILPHARPDDGLLDVCAMPCSNRGQMINLFLHAMAGEHLKLEGTVYAKGSKIRIESPQPIPVQIDGEPAGFTPLNLELLPTRIAFIVPQPT